MFNADDFCNHLNAEINSFFLTISYIDGNNFDDMFNQFLQLLTNAITLHAPMIKLTRKQKKLINKPWISRGILMSIKTKQKMSYLILSKVTWNKNNSTKNMLTNLLKSNLLPKNFLIKIN